jgi:hypothetical protein
LDPERWQLVEKLFHAALERLPEARHALLSDACKDDTRFYGKSSYYSPRKNKPGASWNARD